MKNKDFLVQYKALTHYNGKEKNLILPEGIEFIEQYALYSAKFLQSIHLPASMESINECAFDHNDLLKEITVSEENESYKSVDGVLYTRENDNFSKNEISLVRFPIGKKIDTFVIPSEVTRISYCAFYACKSIKCIEIHKNVTKIEEFAFQFINRNTRIVAREIKNIPTSLKLQAVGTFLERYMNKEADEEYIASNLNYIKRQRKRLIEKKRENLSLYIFLTDKNLIPLEEIDELLEKVKNSEIKALLLEYKNRLMTPKAIKRLARLEERRIDLAFGATPTVKEAEREWRFYTRKDNTISILAYKGRDSVISIPEKIGKRVVSTIEGIERGDVISIAIPDSIVRIGPYAFEYCRSLSSIEIPASVRRVGEGAFENCTSLKTVNIYADLKALHFSTFQACESLESVRFYGRLTQIESAAFEKCTSLVSVTLPEGIKKIGDRVFSNCNSLKSIEFPSGLEELGYYSFYRCDSLCHVKFKAPEGWYAGEQRVDVSEERKAAELLKKHHRSIWVKKESPTQATLFDES